MPCWFFFVNNKSMITFSVRHQNSFCVSLSHEKTCWVHFLPHKTFPRPFYLFIFFIFWNLHSAPMFTCYSFLLPCLCLRIAAFLSILLPPVGQLNNGKPLAGHVSHHSCAQKQTKWEPTIGQELLREPLGYDPTGTAKSTIKTKWKLLLLTYSCFVLIIVLVVF